MYRLDYMCVSYLTLIHTSYIHVSVLVLLTLAFAGESPTCILDEGIQTPYNARSKYHTELAKPSFDP